MAPTIALKTLQDSFSDGISEQLTTELSHFDPPRVLARNTTFAYKKKTIDVQELGRQLNAQYVIEGSFRRVADQISVAAQLIDTRTGTHVWAHTYEGPAASIMGAGEVWQKEWQESCGSRFPPGSNPGGQRVGRVRSPARHGQYTALAAHSICLPSRRTFFFG
jgi:hypothetical protein